MFNINPWKLDQQKERKTDEDIKDAMFRQGITYEEAKRNIEQGQRTLFNFRNMRRVI